MKINMVGAFRRNFPFGTEIAFAKGFKRIGVEVNEIDTSFPNQKWIHDVDFTIVFKWIEGDENWEDLERCSGKKIVYQPDDLRFPHIQEMMRKMRKYCDYALTFDDDGAKLAEQYGYKKTQRLLLTADDELYRPLDVQKDIDVIFIGSMGMGPNHTSRWKMWQIASSMPGVKARCISDLYNMDHMMEALNRSKVVLNHATDVGQSFGSGYGYQCRHFEAGFTKACVLSNVVLNECELKNVWFFAGEKDLQEQIKYLLGNDQHRRRLGQDLYDELMAEHKPEHRAQEIIDFVRGLP